MIIYLIIAAHAVFTLITTLRTRANYLPLQQMMPPIHRFAVRWGPALVAYDLLLAALIYGGVR